MKTRVRLGLGVMGLIGSATMAGPASATLIKDIGGIDTGVAPEIAAYDKFNNRLFATSGDSGLQVFDFNDGRSLTLSATQVDLSGVFGGDARSYSSVAIDPLGRGFGVVAAIPARNTEVLGKAVFFSTADGSILGSVDVGFHPDMVTFTPDGAKILVANEGEAALSVDEGGIAGLTGDAAGSVSVINLAGVVSNAQVAGLTNAAVTTVGLGGLNLTGLRINPSNAATPYNDLEPEYIAVSADGSKAFVTLQEANAVATFDLATNSFTGVNALGTIVQRIDASNTDGVDITSNIVSLFQPDAIASYTAGGKTYYVTANEGDTRDAEEFPFVTSDAVRISSANLDPVTKAGLNVTSAGVGRLNISRFDGNTDADVEIEVPTAFGTRSFTIWDAQTGQMVFDSGSDFEDLTALLANSIFNSSNSTGGGDRDSRSDDKGPEPEGVTIGVFGGRTYAFIGLERVGGLFTYDITDPLNPFFVDYDNSALLGLGTSRPEGVLFISASDSPTGEAFVVLTHEGDGGIRVYVLTPEPTVATLGLLSMGALALRRRRA